MLPTLTFPGNAVFFYVLLAANLTALADHRDHPSCNLGIVCRASCLYRFSLIRPDSVTLGSALVDYTQEVQHVQNDTFQLPDQNVH